MTEGRPKEKPFTFNIKSFHFTNEKWVFIGKESYILELKKIFKEKVVFQADLFPFIAITTSPTKAIISDLWLQDYGSWEMAFVISQNLKTQLFIREKKIIHLEFVRDIKSLSNESNFIDKEAMRSRKINWIG